MQLEAARLQATAEEVAAASKSEKRLLGSVAKKVLELQASSCQGQAEMDASRQQLAEAASAVEQTAQLVRDLKQQAAAVPQAVRQRLQQLEAHLATAASEVQQHQVSMLQVLCCAVLHGRIVSACHDGPWCTGHL